jgi:hypothetical protein
MPLLAVLILTFAPQPDPYDFLRGGLPVALTALPHQRSSELDPNLARFRLESATAFTQSGAEVERRLRASLTRKRGWDETGSLTINPVTPPSSDWIPDVIRFYAETAIGDEVVLIRYAKPQKGWTCGVIVREGRDPWRRLRGRFQRMVGL